MQGCHRSTEKYFKVNSKDLTLHNRPLHSGFKKVSDVGAVSAMQQTTASQFAQRNSRVFVSVLGTSKTFDKVSHAKLIIKLFNVP